MHWCRQAAVDLPKFLWEWLTDRNKSASAFMNLYVVIQITVSIVYSNISYSIVKHWPCFCNRMWFSLGCNNLHERLTESRHISTQWWITTVTTSDKYRILWLFCPSPEVVTICRLHESNLLTNSRLKREFHTTCQREICTSEWTALHPSILGPIEQECDVTMT